jgi:hypothetical protein
VEKIETLQVSKRREDLDRPLVETRGGDRDSRRLAFREIEAFPGHLKSIVNPDS